MMVDNIRPMFVTADFVSRCFKKLRYLNKPNAPADAENNEDMIAAWLEYLEGYTIQEFSIAFKQVVRANKFYPDVSDLTKVMDKNRFGLADDKYAEFKTILKEYRNARPGGSGYRNCDEILGRIIERLGGMFKLSDTKKFPEDGGITRKQFGDLFDDVVEKYYAGYYRDKSAPMVGSHVAAPVGCDPQLLLEARTIIPKLPESIVQQEKKKVSRKDRVSNAALEAQIKAEEKPEPESVSAGQEKPKTMKFFTRLYAIAGQEQPEGCEDRDLNDTEISALKFCLANNPKLANHQLTNPAKGRFQKTGLDFGGFIRYFENGDPLYDSPDQQAVIPC